LDGPYRQTTANKKPNAKNISRASTSSEIPQYINEGKQIGGKNMTPLTENRTPYKKKRPKTTPKNTGGRGGSYDPYVKTSPPIERSPENAPSRSDSYQKGRLFLPITQPT
jgi:hypothetical protein